MHRQQQQKGYVHNDVLKHYPKHLQAYVRGDIGFVLEDPITRDRREKALALMDEGERKIAEEKW